MQDAPRKAAAPMSDVDRSHRLVRALLDPQCYPHPVDRLELIETHISWVVLTGPFAYKVKKPVALPFLDFSTLERRRHFCEEELRINRRLAPQLYLDVVPIGGTVEAPRVGGEPAIEYAVKLVQFDRDATADLALARGELRPEAMLRLAALLARFHEGSPPGRGPAIERLVLGNIAELDTCLEDAGEPYSVAKVRDWTAAECKALGPVFAERDRNGRVREGHGDLHLENLVVLDGELLPFDALEFDAAMRTIDVIDEAAFLVMDLMARGRADLGFTFLNRYLEVAGDYRGARLLRFYLLYRALVRAKVRAIKAAQPRAERSIESARPYLRLADAIMDMPAPLLLITHGLSGSGKTTVTDRLIPRLPALRLRSDLERKRLHGVDAAAHDDLGVGEGRYDAAATSRTYCLLAAFAADVLASRINVIVDATFLSRRRREAFRGLAERCGARFAILHLTAPEETLRARVRARAAARADVSEATEAVLDAQLRDVEPPTGAEGEVYDVDTSVDVDYDGLAAALLAARKSATNAAT